MLSDVAEAQVQEDTQIFEKEDHAVALGLGACPWAFEKALISQSCVCCGRSVSVEDELTNSYHCLSPGNNSR